MVTHYRSLLLTREVRRLLVSSVLARLPLGISSLAILLFVRAQTGSFLAAGLAVGAFTMASAALAPLQGALLDRLGQVLVLAPCALGQGVLFVVLVLLGDGASWASIIIVCALAGGLTPPVSACVRVLWPEIARDAYKREAAYALDAVTQEIIWVSGPLLVGLTIELASPAAAVLLGAVVTMLGTGLFLSMPLVRAWRPQPREQHRTRTGVLSNPGLRALLGSAALMGMMIGALQVGLPALAKSFGSHGLAGVLLALWSAGSMIGGLIYGTHIWQTPVASRYQTILAWIALSIAPLLLVHSLIWGMLASALAGVGLAPMFSCQYTLVNALASPGAVASAFTWQTAALVAGVAGGSALGGGLVALSGASLSFAFGCVCAALAWGLSMLERKRLEPAGALASQG